MQLTKRTPKLLRNNFKLAFFLMSLLLLSSAGCELPSSAMTPTPVLVAADEISLDLTNDWYVETQHGPYRGTPGTGSDH